MTRYTPKDLAQYREIQVYLNGERLEDVFEADDTVGFAVVGLRDESGRFLLRGGEVAKDVRTGRIEVVALPRES